MLYMYSLLWLITVNYYSLLCAMIYIYNIYIHNGCILLYMSSAKKQLRRYASYAPGQQGQWQKEW